MTPQGLGVPWIAAAVSLTCSVLAGAQCPLWTVYRKEEPNAVRGDEVFELCD